MSRRKKFWICAGVGACSLVAAIVIALMMFTPRGMSVAGVQGTGATPTAWGYFQLVAAVLASAGFSSASVWQFIASYLDSHADKLAGTLQQTTGVSSNAARMIVSLAKLTTYQQQLKDAKTEQEKSSLTVAARSQCDWMRDQMFPVSTGGAT